NDLKIVKTEYSCAGFGPRSKNSAKFNGKMHSRGDLVTAYLVLQYMMPLTEKSNHLHVELMNITVETELTPSQELVYYRLCCSSKGCVRVHGKLTRDLAFYRKTLKEVKERWNKVDLLVARFLASSSSARTSQGATAPAQRSRRGSTTAPSTVRALDSKVRASPSRPKMANFALYL